MVHVVFLARPLAEAPVSVVVVLVRIAQILAKSNILCDAWDAALAWDSLGSQWGPLSDKTHFVASWGPEKETRGVTADYIVSSHAA